LRTCGQKLAVRPIAEPDTIAPTINMRHVVQIAKYRAIKKAKTAKAKRRA
jgi:hypothetical protein